MLWFLLFLGQTQTSVEIDLKTACKPLVDIVEQGKEAAVKIERTSCDVQTSQLKATNLDTVTRIEAANKNAIQALENRLKTQDVADTAAISQCFLTGARTFKTEYKGKISNGSVHVFVTAQSVCAGRGFLVFEIHTLGNYDPFVLKKLELRDSQNHALSSIFWASNPAEPIWGATKQVFIAGFTLANVQSPVRFELLGGTETIAVDGIMLPERP